ncbi:MAG: class I SAM-dependent methyltransferase [Myxococcales bacterium]|nr:class I SAM-dependent methyltransferase [Myxococcales bacterium]
MARIATISSSGCLVVSLACAGPDSGGAEPVPSSPASAAQEPAPEQAPGHSAAHGEDHGHGDHGHGDHGHGGHGHAAPDPHHKGAGHHKHHRFDNAEEWAKQFDSPERAAWQKPDAVVESFALAPDATVADIGAGTGYFAARFAAALPSGRVYAQDVEPDMVRYLGERAQKAGLENMVAVKGAAADPSLPAPVDLVFLCDVYHHIDDVEAYFGALAGSLTAGGRVAIVDFKKDAPEDAPGPPAAMRVAADDVVARLSAIGYQLARRDDALLEYQYILEFTRAS